MNKKKSKIAFFSLTSCEGCQFVLLDLGEKFFHFLDQIELLDFSIIEEKPFPRDTRIDIAFLEGLPIRQEEIKILRQIRRQTELLVTIGNCAALGGIPEIKNYQDKDKTLRHIYKQMKNIENPDIKEIHNFVKVDFSLTGCPINGEEFLKCAEALIKGKIPEILQKAVCSECIHQGKLTCFLRKKEPCFGPITLAGCNAVCPQNSQVCLGCRGILKNIKPKKFILSLAKFKPAKEIEESLEIFGIKDEALR